MLDRHDKMTAECREAQTIAAAETETEISPLGSPSPDAFRNGALRDDHDEFDSHRQFAQTLQLSRLTCFTQVRNKTRPTYHHPQPYGPNSCFIS